MRKKRNIFDLFDFSIFFFFFFKGFHSLFPFTNHLRGMYKSTFWCWEFSISNARGKEGRKEKRRVNPKKDKKPGFFQEKTGF